MTLLGRTVSHLEGAGVPSALIGGGALAVHGVARSTEDLDLLVADGRVLDRGFWSGWGGPAAPSIRRGDLEDPLAGVVRIQEGGEVVDVVAGKDVWMKAALARRIWTVIAGDEVPVLDAADLVLTKLAAGGPQDLLDVRLLVAGSAGLRGTVEERLKELPGSLRAVWRSLGI